ncbi:type II toxin-antitoxin system HicA family toxin [Methylococcus sp. EFPC2]|uniref:type II toxin-antitoxin system HicA family toxin n=1 Tax=Methylococcus sp. EFPC2 TaxID=2812648 RepID=UPI001967274B|nr:type II toxin-antitoxin system HicA family toxin [Methylococcus sp. EFPC2]QSA97582.1 type II toxin-antitoxin system HicA family toxin [Methylococcus sp. EFPC2]
MSARLLDDVLEALTRAGASMRCQTLGRHLETLGFVVRDGHRGGHKIYTHPGLPGFLSASYNCDHGKNPEIKRPYINQVVKVLRKYEPELRTFLEDRNHV